MSARDVPSRLSKADLEAARGREIPAVVAPGLDAVFVGINPGLWSGATGHHFAGPGNRFWKALHRSGFTDRVLLPVEDRSLLASGLGVTNLVGRATAGADELADDELRAGANALVATLEPLRPRAIAFLGIKAYQVAFAAPNASLGVQPAPAAGADVWLLPNPSGLNAHYQLPELADRFAEVRRALGRPDANDR